MSRGRHLRWKLVPGSSFATVADAWDALALANGYPPFMRSEIVAAALTEFGAGGETIALGERDNRCAAIGIVRRPKAATWETFQPSQLPLGAFIAEAGFPIEAGLAELGRRLPGFAVVVGATQQDPAVIVRPVDSPRLRSLDYIETARVVVSGTFDDYWSARGKNLRTNTKRQHAKLAHDGVSVRLDCVTDAGEVEDAIAEYGRLESSGWKAGEGTAVAADNAQGRFYTRVFQSCCARGTGRIYRLLFNDAVVAMDLCIEEAGVLVILKTTYDENWKHVSPASLMRHAYFRQIFDAGTVRRIEFYGKVMEWHRRWTDDVRTLYHVNHYRTAWLRALRERVSRGRGEARPQSSR